MTDRILAEIYTGVLAETPMAHDALARLWHEAVASTMALDPGLARKIAKAQKPIIRVQRSEYVAVVLESKQSALIGRQGPIKDFEKGIAEEQRLDDARVVAAARRLASFTPELRSIIARSNDPVREIEALEFSPQALKAITKRVVSGQMPLTLRSGSGVEVQIPAGTGTRRSVLLPVPVRIRVDVLAQERDGAYAAQVRDVLTPTTTLARDTRLRLHVPARLRAAHAHLVIAWVCERPATLEVFLRQTIVGRRVVGMLLCSTPHWRAELNDMLASIPAPGVLTAQDLNDEVASWEAQLPTPIDG